MSSRTLRTSTGLLLVILLLLAGCETPEEAVDAAGDEAAEEQDATPTPDEEPEAEEFRFTYTGEGEEGCSYEGPDTIAGGGHEFHIENRHDEDVALVTIARIAEGHSYDDFLDTVGEERPARPPVEEHNPAVHDWLEGGWRIVLEAEAGGEDTNENVLITSGPYAVFCWGDTPDPGERTKLWPSTPLVVTE